jgi:hypothetical protein
VFYLAGLPGPSKAEYVSRIRRLHWRSNIGQGLGSSHSRCELKPDSNDAFCRSRLVDFQILPPDGEKLVIAATYEVDNIPAESGNCLLVTQRYKFYKEQQGCEPSENLPCARFKPIVKYVFSSQRAEKEFRFINVVQRLHFWVNREAKNTIGVFKNCNTVPVPACFFSGNAIFKKRRNPLRKEMVDSAISSGAARRWDNFHQTFNEKVQEPSLLPPTPDCPECAHIHWRWAKSIPDQQFGHGHPLIPTDSNQSVDFAITRLSAGEGDPLDYRSLTNGESLSDTVPVFWYSATGYKTRDAFFTHGGFFSPAP